jgi:hypothetical protein
VGAGAFEPFREFYFEYSDFQHAYEAGVYVGTNQMGLPLAGTDVIDPVTKAHVPVVGNEGNAQFAQAGGPPAGSTSDAAAAVGNAFRFAINPPARLQINPVFPDLYAEIVNTAAVGVNPGEAGNFCPTRPCPQAIDVQDPGVLVVNYRHEPIGLRIYDPNKTGPDGKPGMQADGQRGDLAFALQTRTDRAMAQMNVQPGLGTSINGTVYPAPINADGVLPGDPFTPMIRTYMGDTVRVKMQAGGHEEEHNASIHGMKWLQAGSGHGKAPNSGWRNAQAGGISEQFTLATPVVPSVAKNTLGSTDYYYSMDGGNDGWWSGMWGLLRAYNLARPNLFKLPTTVLPTTVSNAASFRTSPLGLATMCPSTAPLRVYDVTAVLANDVLPNALGVTVPTAANTTAGSLARSVATMHAGGALKAAGGTLVYNQHAATVTGTAVDPLTGRNATIQHQGPINDPTAILYVLTSDLDAQGKLKSTAPVEPVVIRARAGECVQVTLRNRLPALQSVPSLGLLARNSTAPDLATYSMIQGVVKRDRFGAVGSTTFNSNLFRPSSWVGLNPQLVAYDIERDSGLVIGQNPVATALVAPGTAENYFWYAGDITPVRQGTAFTLTSTPVEFGGANLLPVDKIKQGAKSLVGALVIEPATATWSESTQVFDHQDGVGTRLTRAQATVCPGGQASCTDRTAQSFRSFSAVLSKGLTQYYKDGTPVEHMNGEGVGIPEDSQEASGMALNYGVEPMWFRFGILPQAPFGNVAGGYGGVPKAGDAYSNALAVPGLAGATQGDPATPVFLANAGQPFRMHLTNPFGTTRGSTFTLHGHVWQRDPYVCPSESRNGLAGACNIAGVGSKGIGDNPLGFAQGGQESWNAPSHFEVVSTAGGGNAIKGDYLFRDHASFGNASGVWGIMRVR